MDLTMEQVIRHTEAACITDTAMATDSVLSSPSRDGLKGVKSLRRDCAAGGGTAAECVENELCGHVAVRGAARTATGRCHMSAATHATAAATGG